MFLILNRLRGTEGLWSKIIGLLLALVVQIAFNNPYVSIAVGLGYIIGESFGWGLWVGTLTVQREKGYALHDEGEGRNNGIEWLASHIIKPTQESWLNYCRVSLTIRGFYWCLPTLSPLYFVGFDSLVLLGCIAFLSVGFPIACEIGYLLRDKISFEKYGLSFSGGWELQEGVYGLMQDLVLIILGVSYVIL
jgi:hypothetical protein